MNIDVYYKYDFSYDKNLYMKTLKQKLYEKGIKTFKDFHLLLTKCENGSVSDDTAKSYFNLRRVVPNKLLNSICRVLNLNSSEIMFPNSIPKFEYTKGIGSNHEELNFTSTLLQNVFFYDNVSSSYIYTLSLVLAKYNYLLQKYYYAGLPNIELKELGNVSINFLMDRETKKLLDWKEFVNWKKGLIVDNILNAFYDKYTFVCLNPEDGEMIECKVLLHNKKTTIDNKLLNEINNLLPDQDKIL